MTKPKTTIKKLARTLEIDTKPNDPLKRKLGAHWEQKRKKRLAERQKGHTKKIRQNATMATPTYEHILKEENWLDDQT